MNKENLKLFKYWVREREKVRVERFSSECDFINYTRFCNVNRINDRDNRELHEWLSGAGKKHQKEFMFIYYLGVMLPTETIKYYNGDVDEFYDTIIELNLKRSKGAYISGWNTLGGIKILHQVHDAIHNSSTPEFILSSKLGCSGFNVNQMAVYLRESKRLGFKFKYHPDWDEYYAFGKNLGTGQGLALLGLPLEVVSVYKLRKVLEQIIPEIDWSEINDVSNCLCEFSKYYKMKNPDPDVKVRSQRKYKEVK